MVTPCIGALCPQAGPNAAAHGPTYKESAVNESGEPVAAHGTEELRVCGHKRADAQADGGHEHEQAHQLVASAKCTCGHELVRGCKAAAGTQRFEGKGAKGEGAKREGFCGCGLQADVLAELLGGQGEGGLGKVSAGEGGEAGEKGKQGSEKENGESEKGRGMGNAGWDGDGQGGAEGRGDGEGKGGSEVKGRDVGKGGGEGKGGAESKGGGVHERVDSPREEVKRRDVRWKGRGVGVGGMSAGSRVRGGEGSDGRSVGVNLYERATAAVFANRKQIGSGRNAVVYAASCAITGRKVAVKAYVKSALSALDRHRINREVALLMTSHEHIIQWLGHFEDAQCVHIVQEWASGGDLFEELRASGGHMGEARIAKHILLPLLAALQHMHTKGVVHRDLKPENLLLTFHGTLKVRMPLPLAALAAATAGGVRGRPVCDFGLAINMREERPASRLGTLQYKAPEVCDFGLAINMKEERPARRLHTLQYMAPEVVRMAQPFHSPLLSSPPFPHSPSCLQVCDFGLAINMKEERPASRLGTLQYMAPEVVVGGTGGAGAVSGTEGKTGASSVIEGAYDEKVDIWACGVLVYELVMGHPPFEGSSDMHTATNIMHRELVPDSLPHAMSPACKDFICKVLCKNPSDRPSLLQMLDHPFVSGLCWGRPLFKEEQTSQCISCLVPKG
ncbi:unnamed protein product [Closterium sp. Naga37s-1]|nr:unnamed protein product [Closterium sp. Naga37s-1]